MLILFPAQPFAGRITDEVYAPEQAAAEAQGFTTALLDVEASQGGDLRRALRFLPVGEGESLLYRGWMLRVETYAALHAGLLERSWAPLHSPDDYRSLHHLPTQFHLLADVSPPTVWIEGEPLNGPAIVAALATFGSSPLIVKDYVKSRKHEWDTACYIPDAADTGAAMQVIQTFVERQGSELQGGIVLRRFEDFTPLGRHPKSGMPLTLEFRAFMLDGGLLTLTQYWEEVALSFTAPPAAWLESIAARLTGRFLTLDVAQTFEGDWRLVEIGDAQVAGLPEQLNPNEFYAALNRSLLLSS
jgi:ATP-grasp domain, R2K clade family 3